MAADIDVIDHLVISKVVTAVNSSVYVNRSVRIKARTRDQYSGFALAVLLVYLLLVALFRSYLGPLIILCAVPLGLIGVLAMLFLTRTTLNVQSSMGVIFMVGIVVANGVLLMDFANQLRGQGAT